MTATPLPDALQETLNIFDGGERGAPLTTSEVTDRLGSDRRSTFNRLNRLVDRSHLQTKKVGAHGRVWWRPPSADERKRTSLDASDRERQLERYEQIIETVNDGVCTVDSEGNFTLVNQAYAAMTGYPREELLGAHVSKVMTEETIETARNLDQERAAGERETITFETDIQTADSGTIRVEGSFTLLQIGSDEYERIGIVRNVTGRKERELERYVNIINAVGEPVYELDVQGRITFVNEPLVERLDYNKEELLGQHVSICMEDDAIAQAESRIADLLVDDVDRTTTLEYDLVAKDGERIPTENRISLLTDNDGQIRGSAGVVRDISDRVGRERKLERQIHQQQVVTELGKRALEEYDIDTLLADAAKQVADTLDNDYCKILDLDAEADELVLCHGSGWDDGLIDSASISAAADDSQAACTLHAEQTVVVPDFESDSRFSKPDLLTRHDVRSGISTIIGPSDDPWGILGTHDTAPKEFTDHDIDFVQSVANVLAEAIARDKNKQKLRRQREQLAAVNNLNSAVRDITDAAIEHSSREEIEAIVCERLAASDSYQFAWIGDVDTQTQTVNLRTEAGVEGYLEKITISVDPDDERSLGPTGQAILQQEIQVTENVDTETCYDPWREHVREHSYQSSAAIPISHDGTLYGVLNVYSERLNAFTDEELDVIGQLGDIIGHAIAAINRKRALMSDEIVELEYYVSNVFEAVGADVTTDSQITLDKAIPADDNLYLLYGTMATDAHEALDGLVDHFPHWDALRIIEENEGHSKFELQITEPPILSAVAARGGYVDTAEIKNNNYRIQIHLPPYIDARSITETVQEKYPPAELLAQRQVSRTDDPTSKVEQLLYEDLTDHQRTALEAAYHAGYYKWPRATAGENVAEVLGVSSPTFHQHLRKAERKAFATILETSSTPQDN